MAPEPRLAAVMEIGVPGGIPELSFARCLGLLDWLAGVGVNAETLAFVSAAPADGDCSDRHSIHATDHGRERERVRDLANIGQQEHMGALAVSDGAPSRKASAGRKASLETADTACPSTRTGRRP